MCPLCLTTAVLIASGAISASGLAAIAISKFSGRNAADNDPAQTGPNSVDKRTGR
jgi:hypothetical protein